jgi:hypothetical protein
MSKKQLTSEQKKLDTDIWIIALSTFAIYAIYILYGKQLYSVVQDKSIPILSRLLLGSAMQYGIAGLGITIVCMIRRERFTSFGLKLNGSIKAIVLSLLCFVPYFMLMLLSRQIKSYEPLSIMITDDVLASGYFIKIFGMLVIAIIWGFFEGFNYVVISDKINRRYPSKNLWLDKGAISCAIICVLFHSINFSILGLLEVVTTFILIYGILLVKKYTHNAWGCVLVFLFLWNAF